MSSPNLQTQPNTSLKYIPLPASFSSLGKGITQTASPILTPPCRRCLLDAIPGEEVHLLSYDPFPGDSTSPYRGSSPIYVHAHACTPFTGKLLPASQLQRIMSVRAYDGEDMMVEAEVVESRDGKELERVMGEMFEKRGVRYALVHNAKQGCFAVRVERGEENA